MYCFAREGSRRFLRCTKSTVFKNTPEYARNFMPRVPYCKEAVIKSESIPPLQHLQAIVQHHMPACGLDWRSTPLYDVPTKSKILLDCEKAFKRAIPDNKLGSILTVSDIVKFYKKPPPNTDPYAVFPQVDKTRSAGQIPPNLSFPKVTSEPSPTPKRTRVPFQNYNSLEHSRFLNKQQKETRKKKRRHLTALK